MNAEELRQELDSERWLVGQYAENEARLKGQIRHRTDEYLWQVRETWQASASLHVRCARLRGHRFWLCVFLLAESLVLAYVLTMGGR